MTTDGYNLNPLNTSALSDMKNTISDEETFSVVYKYLLQHTDSPLCICDAEHKIIFVNDYFSELTGFSSAEVIGQQTMDFFDSKYHPTIVEEREKRTKGLISTFEVKFRNKDGYSIPVRITAHPLPNGGTIGIITDLSEHAKDGNIHRMAVESLHNAVWVADEHDVCIYANPALCQLLGYSLEEMQMKTSIDIASTKSKRKIRNELENRARGQVSVYEIELETRSGELIPVRIVANPTPDGGNIAVISDLRNDQTEELAYKHLIENMNEAVWLRSSDGALEFANKHFCKLIGYDFEEVRGDTNMIYWDDSSKEKVRAEQEKRKHGVSSVYQATVCSKSGELIPVLVSASSTIDGGSFGILTDLRDILAKENIYQNLVEHMNEAMWLGDKDENTIYVNPKFCELTKYTAEEIIGRPSYDFWDEDSIETVRRQNMLRERGQASHYEGKLKTRSGQFIPVLVSGTPTYDGGTIGIITDLRELKKKEQELGKRDHYLATVIEKSADGIISTDTDGNITSWNSGAEKIFGFMTDEVIGKDNSAYIPREKYDSGEIDHNNKEIARKGFIRDFRTQRKHKDGHLIDVSLTKSALHDDEYNFIGYSIIYRDVSLQKKWEGELNLRFDNLKNAYIELGKKGRHMDYFVDLLDGIVGDFEINNIADFIIGATAMITKVDACTLRAYDKDRDILVLEATNGVTVDWYDKGSTPFKGSIDEKSFETKKPLKVLDLNQEPLYKGQKLALKHGLNSMLVIPLYVKDELLGTLKLYISKESKFELLDNDFIENFAKIASIGLKLRKKSTDA
ncbi:PAS domain S-box protein [Candidatus Peregrinibacteria bacterium]|jgi:PAS domain S-box-containing protein|nr:PAS domain S-box protein [Candidatus Peregrinibacteria bacterium]